MALTKDFTDTVRERAQHDGKFRRALLREAMDTLLAGDLALGKALIRDYINATIGFEELSARTEIPSKSLMRMFSRTGNPNARHLLDVLGHLQRAEGVQVVTSIRRAS